MVSRALAACVTVVTLAAVRGAAAPARANMANPQSLGELIGEPSGALADVAITAEELTLDLRPLASGAPALVTASYHLENRGAARTVSLLFVSPGLASGSATLDGAAVAVTEIPLPTELPPSWVPPPERAGRYPPLQKALSLSLALKAGAQIATVRYEAHPPTYHGSSRVYRTHQIEYTLAPARAWGGFGTLDVKVLLAPGWTADPTPALARDGDVLTGHFSGVPADALTIDTAAPDPSGLATSLSWVGGALGLGLAALVATLLGRRAARKGSAIGPGVGAGAAGFALAALGVVGGLVLSGSLLDAAQVSRTWSYGQLMGDVVMTMAFGLVGLLVAWPVCVVATRRAAGSPTAAAAPTPAP